MSECKFQQRKIQIAQNILNIRGENSSSDEEELAEIYEESHSDFTVSLEVYDWPFARRLWGERMGPQSRPARI